MEPRTKNRIRGKHMQESLLQVSYPEICKEWDYGKNTENGLRLETITKGSHAKAWWVCPKGHSYSAIIKQRVYGQNCPYCSGKKVLVGYNDLLTTNPQLASEWNYEKNDLTPADVTEGSSKKIWWICKHGHEWESKVASRKRGHGCPYCAGLLCISGENDLETLFPKVAQEWNYEKNGDLSPSDIKGGSNKRVWWKCRKCGNEWIATPNQRTGQRTGCPHCATTQTSFSEQVLFYYVKRSFPSAIHRYLIDGFEIDVYIPNQRIGIEYDGVFFHGVRNRVKQDSSKDEYCIQNGIKLYRIRENGLKKLNTSYCIIRDDISYRSLEKCINELLNDLIGNNDALISIEHDFADIQNQIYREDIENSLSLRAPQLVKEWNYERNGYLKPEHIPCYSNKKVWWRCSLGHEWITSVAHRMDGENCPVCAGRKVLAGFNDLATINPSLTGQWDYEKNERALPTQFTANSHKKVWWKCKKGHSWCATIKRRKEGNNCPYCSNQRVLDGYNDLETKNSILLSEWDYEKNAMICRPNEVSSGSTIKVWWRCKCCNHSWKASISKRTNGRGCPECAMQSRKQRLSKHVLCTETGREFSSLDEAASWAGVSKSAISMAAIGKTNSSAGYHWKYV